MRRWIRTAGCMVTAGLLCMSLSLPVSAFRATSGTAESGIRIRQEPSTTSKQVSSTTSGHKLDVIDQVKGDDGQTWYKVRVDDTDTGYILADYVTLQGGAQPEDNDTDEGADSPNEQDDSDKKETEKAPTVTDMTPQEASVTNDGSINVRQGVGTGSGVEGSLSRGAKVSVTGKATGSDGKTWYRISYTSGGSKHTGYVRSDLIGIGVEVESTDDTETENAGTSTSKAEENGEDAGSASSADSSEASSGASAQEGASTSVATGASNADQPYDLQYLKDEKTGAMSWYLIDTQNREKAKVVDLLENARSDNTASDQLAETMPKLQSLQDQNRLLRTVLIIAAILFVILMIALVFLIFKVRDLLYYDDDVAPEEEDEHERRRTVKPQRDMGSSPKGKMGVRTDAPLEDSRRRTDDGLDRIREREHARRPGEGRSRRPEGPGSRPRRLRDGEPADRPGRPRREKPADRPETLSPHEEAAAKKQTPVKPDAQGEAPKKPRNFAADDDFEFEFLDLDDDQKL